MRLRASLDAGIAAGAVIQIDEQKILRFEQALIEKIVESQSRRRRPSRRRRTPSRRCTPCRSTPGITSGTTPRSTRAVLSAAGEPVVVEAVVAAGSAGCRVERVHTH